MSSINTQSYYLISACLLGINCRYDGSSSFSREINKHLKNKSVLVVCPEQMGALGVPRSPCQIASIKPDIYDGYAVWKKKASISSAKGKDFTRNFIKGCKEIEMIVKNIKIECAFLKSRSPSCGCGLVYTRDIKSGKVKLIKGDGVLTAWLKKRKIPVKSIR